MIGGAGSRHLARRRSSLASASPSLLSGGSPRLLPGLSEEDDGAPAPRRRRAVDTSDLRSCALVQTRMKTWKNYPE